MEPKELSVFPMGKKNDAFAEYFIGQSYLDGVIIKSGENRRESSIRAM